MVNISKRLTELRKKQDMSQADFAERMGTNKVQVSRYETGERTPTVDYIIKLVEVFKINTNWLIAGNGEMFLDQEKRAKEPKDDGFDETIKALQKLTPDRQKYYYHKIMAESLERSGEEDETKSPQAREEHDALFA